MKDLRTPFEETLQSFRSFVEENDKPTNFLWLSQDRVCVIFSRIWIYRPDEIKGNDKVKDFYESVRSTDSSIKMLGLTSIGDRYITVLEKMPSPLHYPKRLYMSMNPHYRIHYIRSLCLWRILRSLPLISKRNNEIIESISLQRTMKYSQLSNVPETKTDLG